MIKNNDIITLLSDAAGENGWCFKKDGYVYVCNNFMVIKMDADLFDDSIPEGDFYFKKRTIVKGINPNYNNIDEPVKLVEDFLNDIKRGSKESICDVVTFYNDENFWEVANKIARAIATNIDGFIDVKLLITISKMINKLVKNDDFDDLDVVISMYLPRRTVHIESSIFEMFIYIKESTR